VGLTVFAGADSAGQVRPTEARAKAYIYGFPMVNNLRVQ
jgi:hypothetical protein